MECSQAAAEFYAAAKNLNRQIDAMKVCDESNMGELLKALAELYLKALCLPMDKLRDLRSAPFGKEISHHAFYNEYCRKVDFKNKAHYHEFFDPYDARSAVMGNLADDIADILSDIETGMILYESDRQKDAVSQWKDSFCIHWGEHITGAIRALDSVYRRYLEGTYDEKI